MAKRIRAPVCPGCGREAVLVSGARIYPHRPDLAAKQFWLCDPCEAWSGCHPGGKRPLGTPAGRALRKARQILHNDRLDPLWKTAIEACGYHPEDPRARAIITNTARARVYEYLAWKLGLDRDECHTGMFDIETCRRAWSALYGVDYPTIRAWAKARKERAKGNDHEQLRGQAPR